LYCENAQTAAILDPASIGYYVKIIEINKAKFTTENTETTEDTEDRFLVKKALFSVLSVGSVVRPKIIYFGAKLWRTGKKSFHAQKNAAGATIL
jgi:hypothetical protein